MQRSEPGAAGQEARRLSTILCGPPLLDICSNWCFVISSATIPLGGVGGCIAQRKQSCYTPSRPGFESRLCQDFFSLLLSVSTVFRSNPSRAKQWISQMQLAVTSRAKNYKKSATIADHNDLGVVIFTFNVANTFA